MLLVDSLGRRTLMIQGSVYCGVALVLVGIADALGSAVLMITAMCLFILAFSASYAGIFWVLLSELFSMGGKAPAAALATAVMFAAGMAFLHWCMLMFPTMCLFILAFSASSGCCFRSCSACPARPQRLRSPPRSCWQQICPFCTAAVIVCPTICRLGSWPDRCVQLQPHSAANATHAV